MKLSEIDNRLKFSPFIAGSKVSFVDILLEEMLTQMQGSFGELGVDAILKKMSNVGRTTNYVQSCR